MPARESEALVLRTYPFREADLVVVYFTRDRGKLRGIARGVRRPKSRFGAALERMAHVRIEYFQKQTVELARVDRAELIGPSLTMRVGYAESLALDYLAEVADGLLPDHEPSDAHFRLLLLGLEEIGRIAAEANGDGPGPELQRLLTYFGLWSLRLSGWLPPLDVCLDTGEEIAADQTCWFDRARDGLLSTAARTSDSWPLTAESRRLAREMLRTNLSKLSSEGWSRDTAGDLRRFLNQRLESHLERRLKSWSRLAELERS